jgi:hypothetical protein
MRFRWLAITLFALSCGIILVGAGHGVGFLWFFAIAGWAHHTMTAALSFIGYGSLVIGLLLSPNHKLSYPYLTTAGCSILLAAISAALTSDHPEGTIIWSIPMFFFFLIYQIIAWSGDEK